VHSASHVQRGGMGMLHCPAPLHPQARIEDLIAENLHDNLKAGLGRLRLAPEAPAALPARLTSSPSYARVPIKHGLPPLGADDEHTPRSSHACVLPLGPLTWLAPG